MLYVDNPPPSSPLPWSSLISWEELDAKEADSIVFYRSPMRSPTVPLRKTFRPSPSDWISPSPRVAPTEEDPY